MLLDRFVDNITQRLTDKIKKELPDVDEERAEVINYGLQLMIGEVPKTFILLGIAYLLGVFKLTLITFFVIIPYRAVSGGFHLKTHIGCIVTSSALYSGVAYLSKLLVMNCITKYIVVALAFCFGIIMITMYAPADTESVPIINKELRKKKKITSYIIFSLGLLLSIFISDNIISNIIIFGYLLQSFMITRFAYRITNNRYGHEVYYNSLNEIC